MHRIILTTVVCFTVILANAQVFNTAETLKPLKFNLGVAPVYFNNNFGLYLMGGVGIKSDIDFSLKYAVLETEDYFGADLEWKLLNRKSVDLSLTTGCHNYFDFGLDVSGNVSFNIKSDIAMYTGLDIDINFGDDLYAPFWIPVGVQIGLNRTIAFIFEAEIPLNPSAYPIIDGGFSFRF
ncbi:MAG: hypothetical protein JXB00_13535 [Bacteroidales bacterium]|nr:hypothetical protein [Bacteroidales bacterium]